jgi:hypothetical protein
MAALHHPGVHLSHPSQYLVHFPSMDLQMTSSSALTPPVPNAARELEEHLAATEERIHHAYRAIRASLGGALKHSSSGMHARCLAMGPATPVAPGRTVAKQ